MTHANGDPRISPRSYGTAVILSGVFGLVGVQHFYLGRWVEGVTDVGLTIAWITCFALGDWAWGAFFLLGDLGHTGVVTVLLLTGNFRDGAGRLVCYPGQKLPPIGPRNHPMRRDLDGLR